MAAADESLVDSLNTEERRILADSTDSVSSSLLLDRVRVETVRAFPNWGSTQGSILVESIQESQSTVRPIDMSTSTINEAKEE